MRIRIDNAIETITSIDLVKAYEGENGETCIMSVYMTASFIPNENHADYVGYYDLEAITEAEADENYNAIAEKLLVHGWCEDTDFQNFIWY